MTGKIFSNYNEKIIIDLDGTLTLTDTLHESILCLLKDNFFNLLKLPAWLLQGKAGFKAKVTDHINLNIANLPYNNNLIDWLKEQKNTGKKLILCSATDQRVAKAVADYLDLFDEVIASDGKTNIAGINKRAILDSKFGFKGYDYAGNSLTDVEVWKGANQAIIVNASKSVTKQAEKNASVYKVFPAQEITLTHWRKVFRLHQWLKNLLLFVPILAAHQIESSQSIFTLFLAFISFSLCASAVYITNDLLDLESDRKHPRKRLRPFASGIVPIKVGAILSPILTFTSFLLALTISKSFTVWLSTYFILTCLYSVWLKRLVLIDCLILAGLYTLRIIAGAMAVNITLSFWLLAFSIFIFLSLAFVKRYAELKVQLDAGNKKAHGRGYIVEDTSLLQTLGVTAGYVAVLISALYLQSEIVVRLYTQPQFIWFVVPLLLFWVSWIWLKAHRGQMHDDPVIFALRDRTSQIVTILIIGSFVLATKGISL